MFLSEVWSYVQEFEALVGSKPTRSFFVPTHLNNGRVPWKIVSEPGFDDNFEFILQTVKNRIIPSIRKIYKNSTAIKLIPGIYYLRNSTNAFEYRKNDGVMKRHTLDDCNFFHIKFKKVMYKIAVQNF